MLKVKLITGLFFLLLAGCASLPDKVVSNLGQESNIKETDLNVVSETKTDISPEVLYLLMTAEIAGQRNQYDVALEAYLRAANKVDDARVAERAAKIGLFLKNTKKTDEALGIWLKLDGQNLRARKISLITAVQRSDKPAAVVHLSKLLEQDPAGFESTSKELIKSLSKQGRAEFFSDVLERLSLQHQNQSVVFYMQSLLAMHLKKPESAKEKVNRALIIQPEWTKALILRAQLAAQRSEFSIAKKDLVNVLEKEPGNDRVRKMLAQVLIKLDDYDGAVLLYQDVLDGKFDDDVVLFHDELYKKSIDAQSRFAIALIYLQQGKDEQAENYLKKLENNSNWSAQVNFYLGRIAFKNKRFEDAFVRFEKVTQGNYVYDASMATVSVLLNQKKYVEAEKHLTQLTLKYPQESLNLILLKAELFSEQKKYQQAYDVLTDALESHKDDKDILYTRALVSEKLDRIDALEADLKTILLKHPNDANILNALGYTLADRTERLSEAESYLLQAIKLKPDEAVIIDSMGWLRFKQGKTDEALNYLRKAFAKLPESEIAAHLAEVLWFMGSKDDSRDVFDKAFSEDTDNEYLLKFKERVLDQESK